MPEEKEKVEDFVSLWRKKMIDDPKKPDTPEEIKKRIIELEEENERLRAKITENIELISKTEDIIRKTIDENTKLKEQIKQGSLQGTDLVKNLQKDNIELSNKYKNLLSSLTEKDNIISVKDNELNLKKNELNIKNNEISELKLKLSEAQSALEFLADTAPKDTPEITESLVKDLQSELSKKKTQISELEAKIEELEAVITTLNEKLIEKEIKSPVDFVVQVETPKQEVIRPQPVQTSSTPLEILCQDLQADLNKYKRIVDNLTKEKSELKEQFEKGGFKLEPGEIKELRDENKDLKTELSQLQEYLHEKSKATAQSLSLVEAERLIEDLREELKNKDNLIKELKTTSKPQLEVPEGPMAGLVKELQTNINKLKIELEEKNNIIEKLKSS